MKDTLLDNLHMADINPRICGVEAGAPGHSFGPAVREYFCIMLCAGREYSAAGNGSTHCRRAKYS